MSGLSPRKSWYKWLPFTAQTPRVASVYLTPDESLKSGLVVTPIDLSYNSSVDISFEDGRPSAPTRISSYDTDLSTPSCSSSSHDSQLITELPPPVRSLPPLPLPFQRPPPLHISASGHRELTTAERAKRAELIQALAADQALAPNPAVSPTSPKRSKKLRKSPPPTAGLQRSATLFQLSNLARSRSTTHIPEDRVVNAFSEPPPVPLLPPNVSWPSQSAINLNEDAAFFGSRDDTTPVPSSPSTASANISVYSNAPLIRRTTVTVVQRQFPATETPKTSPRKLSKRRPPPPVLPLPSVEPPKLKIGEQALQRLELAHLASEPPPRIQQRSAQEYWMQRRALSESGHGSGFGASGDLPITMEEGNDPEQTSQRADSPEGFQFQEMGEFSRDSEFWGPADSLRNQSHRYPPISKSASVLPVQLSESPSTPALMDVAEYPPIIPASAPPHLRPILARGDTDRSRRWTLASSSGNEDKQQVSPSDSSDAIYMKSVSSVPFESLATSRALLAVHELHSTERKYRASLLQLQRGETLPPGPPSLVHAYLPALLDASREFLNGLENDAGFSLKGAANAFTLCEAQIESAVVAWCGIVGQLFTGDSDTTATGRSRRFSIFGLTDWDEGPSTASAPTIKITGVGPRLPKRARTLGQSAFRKSMPELPSGGPAAPVAGSRLPTARDLAIQPTQRVTRYVLFFKELMSHADDSEDEYHLVQQALDAAMRIAEKCNRAQDNAAFLRAPPPSPPRKLVRESRGRHVSLAVPS